MTLYVFNEVCSEGWKYGNEAIPEVFTDLDKAIERGYERYLEVWKEVEEENLGKGFELEDDEPVTKEEFYEEAKNGKGRCIVIQLYDYHYQYEFYDVTVDDEEYIKETI